MTILIADDGCHMIDLSLVTKIVYSKDAKMLRMWAGSDIEIFNDPIDDAEIGKALVQSLIAEKLSNKEISNYDEILRSVVVYLRELTQSTPTTKKD